jgi:hypothetical protein
MLILMFIVYPSSKKRIIMVVCYGDLPPELVVRIPPGTGLSNRPRAEENKKKD